VAVTFAAAGNAAKKTKSNCRLCRDRCRFQFNSSPEKPQPNTNGYAAQVRQRRNLAEAGNLFVCAPELQEQTKQKGTPPGESNKARNEYKSETHQNTEPRVRKFQGVKGDQPRNAAAGADARSCAVPDLARRQNCGTS